MTEKDPRLAQYEAERAAAVEIAHKAMLSSYIGPPPKLRGDAERMVTALILAGWTPPGTGSRTEHVEYMLIGNVEKGYPVTMWYDVSLEMARVYARVDADTFGRSNARLQRRKRVTWCTEWEDVDGQ